MLGLRGVVAVLAVVGIAVAIGIIIPGHAARAATAEPLDEQGDPLKLIHKAEVLSELSADKPLRLAITGAFEEPKAGSQLKFFYTSHAHYGGPITPAAIEKVLAAQRVYADVYGAELSG